MSPPGPSGFNLSMVNVKIEPGLEMKEENCEDLHVEMCTTAKVNIGPKFEVKTEECENFDDKALVMVDNKKEPGNDLKMEKIGKIAESSSYHLMTEKCQDMDAEADEDVGENLLLEKRRWSTICTSRQNMTSTKR